MLTARVRDTGCLAEGQFALNVNHFTTGLPGLDCLTIKCTKEIKIILPVPYGKEEKKKGLLMESLVCARLGRPYWGRLKAGKSCALVVFTKDNALFSLQLVLWQISLPLADLIALGRDPCPQLTFSGILCTCFGSGVWFVF